MLISVNHPLIAEFDFKGVDKLRVRSGVLDCDRNRLDGIGIPCMAAWPPKSLGTMIELDPDEMVKAGFDFDELWLAWGCRWGEFAVPEYEGKVGSPVCGECLSEGINTEPKELPKEQQGVCWCCVANSLDRIAEARDLNICHKADVPEIGCSRHI